MGTVEIISYGGQIAIKCKTLVVMVIMVIAQMNEVVFTQK